MLYYPKWHDGPTKIDLLPTVMASQLSWWSTAPVSQRSRVRIPLKPDFFFRLLFRNCLNCVSTAKIFHNVITHNRGTNPVTIMLYYPQWHDGPTKIDLLPTVMASQLSWWSTAAVSQRSRVQIPLKPEFFFYRLLFRNCLNCVSTAKIFHNVITHNRGTNPVTIMLYYPQWHDGPTKIDLLPTVMASQLSQWSTAPVSQRSRVRIPLKPEFFFFRLLFRNCLNCVSTAKIFHNVITHNRGTNPVTIMLYYPQWHDGPTKIDLLPTVMASQLKWWSSAPVSQRSRFRIPLKPEFFFRLLFRNCLNCVSTAKIFHNVITHNRGTNPVK